jgi:hypothetical protein
MTGREQPTLPLLRNIQRVRRRLTDGTSKLHFYHRFTKTKLPMPSDPGFQAAYEEAERSYAEQNVRAAAQRLAEMNIETSILPTQSVLPVATKLKAEDLNSNAAPEFSEGPTCSTYLTPEEVCRRWRNQHTPETLANWRSLQIGPPYSKFGRAVLYRADLLVQWERKYLFICDPVKIGAGNDRDPES